MVSDNVCAAHRPLTWTSPGAVTMLCLSCASHTVTLTMLRIAVLAPPTHNTMPTRRSGRFPSAIRYQPTCVPLTVHYRGRQQEPSRYYADRTPHTENAPNSRLGTTNAYHDAQSLIGWVSKYRTVPANVCAAHGPATWTSSGAVTIFRS